MDILNKRLFLDNNIDNNKNLTFCVSPASILIILYQIFYGSNNQIKKDFTKIFGDINVLDELNNIISNISEKVVMVNNIFYNKINIKKKYINDLKYTKFIKLNILNNINKINNQISKITNNKINNILSKELIKEDTLILFINVLYYKGNWKIRLEDKLDIKFRQANNNFMNVPSMGHNSINCNYYENNKIISFELELQDELNMGFIKIKEKNDILEKLKDIYENINFNELINNYDEYELNIIIPKFKIESYKILNDSISKMGLDSLFNKPDLSNISDYKNLFIDKIIQKTSIEINNDGVEGSSVTIAIINKELLLTDNKKKAKIVLDNVFIWYLRYEEIILFYGIYDA